MYVAMSVVSRKGSWYINNTHEIVLLKLLGLNLKSQKRVDNECLSYCHTFSISGI